MCRYAERIVSREAALMLGRDNADLTMATVDVDKQCRGCMPRYEEKLSAAGCVHKEEFPSALRYAYCFVVRVARKLGLVFNEIWWSRI